MEDLNANPRIIILMLVSLHQEVAREEFKSERRVLNNRQKIERDRNIEKFRV